MIVFDLMPLHRVYEEIKPNVARHYTEMTEGDDYGPPDMDWDTYISLSLVDQCVGVTARDDRKLIGYSAYVIGRNPRYKEIIQASSHGIFLEKEYRGRLSGVFIKKADGFLKKIGVHETDYTLSDDRVGHFLGREGYQPKYRVWSVKYGK